MIRVDLHCHSNYSPDAWASPVELVERAFAVGLDRIAITDHDEVAGALQAQAVFGDHVIVGEEIHCACGTHLIGLFLRERIPSRLSIDETAERIRDQGGIVYAPHPYAYARRATWFAERALAVADAVEVFNSRAFLPGWNRKAERAAHEVALPAAAASDSHFPWELGRAYTEMPAFLGAREFAESLHHARPVGLRTGSPWLHVSSIALSTVRKLTGHQRSRLLPSGTPTACLRAVHRHG